MRKAGFLRNDEKGDCYRQLADVVAERQGHNHLVASIFSVKWDVQASAEREEESASEPAKRLSNPLRGKGEEGETEGS